MDDGYADGLREYDRADLAERRLKLATDALKAIRRVHMHTAPIVKLVLKRIDEER